MKRDPDKGMIAGVCTGLAEWFGIDALWIRLLFVFAFLYFGAGPILYVILWICMSTDT